MIKMSFTVRPEQGEPSDFDLGDIVCEGESGTLGSAGHVPDQGMMIYLSVALLLDSLRPLLAGERKTVSFVGTDSSFRLDFRRERRGVVAVAVNGTAVGKCTPEELADAVLRALHELDEQSLSALPAESGARSDLFASAERFRAGRPRL
ncbi:hypothetical protein PUR59_23185 [Streptomyces sp. SP18ES09]|uniref:hypothetical protein n=1 Tax=Streptomyces sp. SP18ES09 TaxID=3002532 RepID=UPI002E76AC6D|nr:hypothetical protein [Streptomyces sp. SP18ES09]MEE1817912.1 hypothetical protein [Streptomyces sp. SP18ES09]